MEVDDSSPQQGGAGGTGEKTKHGGARSQKTPLQKEVLEASYQLNANPNEDHRRALAERIGLDEKQVSAWFINRRRKDKRAEENKAVALAVQQNLATGAHTASGSGAASTPPPPQPPAPKPPTPPALQAPAAVGPSVPSPAPAPAPAPAPPPPQPAVSPEPEALQPPTVHPHHVGVMSAPARPALPPQPPPPSEAELQEYQELLEIAKTQMDQPYRADGPPLAAVFDDLPANVDLVKRKRVALDNFVADTDGMGQFAQVPAMMHMQPTGLLAKTYQKPRPLDKAERERQRAEEERLRELERAERERRKVTDRQDKERAKEEARRMREMEKQRQLAEKEARKVEAARDKERRAEEKKKEKEEKKREKELAKALDRQGRAFTRVRQHTTAGPPDDEDVEWEQLLQEQRAAAGYEEPAPGSAGGDGAQAMEGVERPQLPPPERPVFPSPSLNLCPAFDSTLEEGQLGAEVLMVAAFLHTFSDLTGLRPTPTADELAQAVFDGPESMVLAAVHTSLLRLLLSDMEDAHASGATASVGPGSLVDRATVNAAHQLEAAWSSWGYDVDVWRAHLNVLTWPEVLREMAVAVTLAPARKPGRRPGRPGPAHNRPKMGEPGEDLYEDQAGGLKLRLPARYTVGSVKAAAWQVLAECDASGLTITEIARRIQESGYRDLRSSRTPEASVAGALSRDVLFVRVAPSTFALASVLQHQKRLLGQIGIKMDDHAPGDHPKSAHKSSSTPAPEDVPSVKHSGGGTKGKEEPKQESAVKQEPEAVAADSKPLGNGSAAPPVAPTPVKQEGGNQGVKQEGGEPAAAQGEQPSAGTTGAGGGTPAPGAEEDEYSGDDDYDDEGNPVEAAAVVYSKEHWVNCLAAVDYGQLSIRERMDALSWLLHTVVDGPSIRGVMDARVEDAQNMKKKLLEDAKAEKRKRQEEAASKARAAAAEATRKLEELQAAGPGGASGDLLMVADAQTAAQLAMEAAAVAAQRAAAGAEDVEEERVSKQRRLDNIRMVEEEKSIRVEPLGLDRRHNRYWRVTAVVHTDGSTAVPDSLQQDGCNATPPPQTDDPDVGRVYIESADGSSWRLLSDAAQLDQLSKSLEPKGVREGMFSSNLLHYMQTIKQGMPSKPITVAKPLHPTPEKLKATWSELLPLLRPLAATCGSHHGQNNGIIPLPASSTAENVRVHKLKQDMASVLHALPPASMIATFDRPAWLQQVADAGSPIALRRLLGQLETAIVPAYLNAAFQRNPHIQPAAWSSPLRQQQEAEAVAAEAGSDTHMSSAVAEALAWLPPTYAAVTLRLLALDAALYYKQSSKCGRDRLLGYKYILRPGPLLRPSDGADVPATAVAPQLPVLSTEYGGVAVACGLSLTQGQMGKPRHVLLFPLLPMHTLTTRPRDFELPDIADLRQDIDEADASGSLQPGTPVPHSQLVAVLRAGSKSALTAQQQQAKASSDFIQERARRIEAMKVASGVVRSAFARATQSRGGRDKDKLSKARSHKARKVRQSNLSKEWERQRSDDEGDGNDPDYGEGYDDGGDDDILMDGGEPQAQDEQQDEEEEY